jgi:hypothetical protein
MFEKCLRGDVGDNVQSSYPKIRKTKIDEAYLGDNFQLTNIMAHEFDVEIIDKDGAIKSIHYKTKELFEENLLLMGLRSQPKEIKSIMDKCITLAMQDRGKFKLIDFLKLCGRHQLDRISSNASPITKMLNTNSSGRTLD